MGAQRSQSHGISRRIFGTLYAGVTDPKFLVRYLAVGVGNLTVNFGTFWILYHFLGVWYVLASCIGFVTRFIFKFFALRVWVYGHQTKALLGEHFAYFSLLEVGSYIASLPPLTFLVEILRFPPPAAVIVTILTFYVVGMTASRFIFKAKKN